MRKFQKEKKNNRGLFWELENRMGGKKRNDVLRPVPYCNQY